MGPQPSSACESCLLSRQAAAINSSPANATKITLQWIAVASLVLIFISFAFRYYALRRQQRSLSDFFVFMAPARPQPRSHSEFFPHSLPLTPFPPGAHTSLSDRANRNGMRVNAEDTDLGGRRAGQRDQDDGDDLDDKDLLPSYEKRGGPPGYPDLGSGGVSPSVAAENLTRPVPAHDIHREQGASPNPPFYMDTGGPRVSDISH